VAKWLLATSQGLIATAALAPLQTAFAKGSPCEVVAMGVQAHVDALHESAGWLLLQVDTKNGFNSIHRPPILGVLEQRCPAMLPWVQQASQPAPLLVGREVIWSTLGVRQGDTFGPFLFAAGIQAALDTLPYTKVTWMMGSSWARWRRSLGALQRPCPLLGLVLNLRKTTVWGPGMVPASSPLAAATRLHLEEGTKVLGVPIHCPVYHSPVRAHLETLKGTFARTCAAVAALADTQSAHALMRSCLGPVKVQYALRTLSLRHRAAFAADVTATQRARWDAVVGAPDAA